MIRPVLIINCGWEQERLIKRVAKSHPIIGIHHNTDYVCAELFESICIHQYHELAQILALAKKLNICGVISNQCDYSLFAQAFVCSALELKGPSLYAAQISNSKLYQRTLAKKHNIGSPNFIHVLSLEQAIQAAKELTFPVIIKPIDNRGSFGVHLVSHCNDVKPAFFDALSHSISHGVLVEQYIEGINVAVDGYCFNGKHKSLAVGLREMDSDNNQVALAMEYSTLDEKLHKKISTFHENVSAAFEYNFGMSHGEYIINSQEDIYLVENTNRGGGVYLSEIAVPYVSEVDHLGNYIEDCMARSRVMLPCKINNKALGVSFLKFNPGIIKSLSNNNLNNQEIIAEKIFRKIGDKVTSISHGANRDGMLIYTNLENKARLVKDYLNKVEISYE